MKHYFFLLVLSLLQLPVFGQDSDYSICDCCTYSILQYKNDYDPIFLPSEIKQSGIREVSVYTTSRRNQNPEDTLFQLVDSEYVEMVFRFNGDGYVSSQTLYNRRGRYHSIYEFTRDDSNRVLSKSFHYLDESGNRVEDFGEQKWIYVYEGTQLVMIKKLDVEFKEQPDRKSDYTIYAYDQHGRMVTENRQMYYFGRKPSWYKTTIKYDDASNTSVARTRSERGAFLTERTIYTESQKPLHRKRFSGRSNNLLDEEFFTYNVAEQLVRYEVRTSGFGTECPDGGNYTNIFYYSGQERIERILHQYEATQCELRFEYK